MSEEQQKNIEKLRKQLLFRSWHRGTRESDLILGRFAEKYLADFNDEEVSQYQALLEENDPDIYNWIVGREPIPAAHQNSVVIRLCDLYKLESDKPKN